MYATLGLVQAAAIGFSAIVLAGLPSSQLAVLPGTTHVSLVKRADWLLSMIGEFLDAPMPEAEGTPGGRA